MSILSPEQNARRDSERADRSLLAEKEHKARTIISDLQENGYEHIYMLSSGKIVARKYKVGGFDGEYFTVNDEEFLRRLSQKLKDLNLDNITIERS